MKLPTILFVVFLVLKLCNVIDWSWWWITAPLWGIFALKVVVGTFQELSEESARDKSHKRLMQRLEEAKRRQEELRKQNQK